MKILICSVNRTFTTFFFWKTPLNWCQGTYFCSQEVIWRKENDAYVQVFFKSVYKVYKLKHFLFSLLHLPLLNPKTCNLNKSWLKCIFWHMSWSSNNMNEASARIYMGNLNYGDPYNLCLLTISSESGYCKEADLWMEVSIKQREYDVVDISKQTRK